MRSYFIAFLIIFNVVDGLINDTDQIRPLEEIDYARSIKAEYGDDLKESYLQDLTDYISRSKRSHGGSCELSKVIGINSECTCQGGPRKTMLELPMINGDVSGYSLQMPRCVSIERCGSSCSSPRYKCVATQMEMVKVPVSILSPGKFMRDECKLIDVEKHTKCDCVCGIKQSDCEDFQVFDADTCKCACRMNPRKCPPNKRANYQNCRCECLVVRECSSSEKFNDAICDCEEIRSENIEDYNYV